MKLSIGWFFLRDKQIGSNTNNFGAFDFTNY